MSRELYYRHSGKFRLNAPTTMLSGGLVTAVVLGALYGLINWYCPFIYIRVLVLFALGGAIAITLGRLALWTHTRLPSLALVIGLVCGVAALYTAWVTWLFALSGWSIIAWSPRALAVLIPALAEQGVWSFGSGSPGSGDSDPVSGPVLWLIWITEAAVIVGFAAAGPVNHVRKAVYCENCRAWVNKKEIVQPFAPVPVGERDALRRRLVEGDLAALASLEPVSEDAVEYSRFLLIYCETCDQLNLLTVKSTRTAFDSKGNATEIDDVIVENLYIDRESRELITKLVPASRVDEAKPTAASTTGDGTPPA